MFILVEECSTIGKFSVNYFSTHLDITNAPMCILVEECSTIGKFVVNYFDNMTINQGLVW
jgi:hypothetical protein